MKPETLDKLNINQKATVESVDVDMAMYRRMLDLGFVKGTAVECLGRAPFGDPAAYLVRGAMIALRKEDASGITVSVEGTAELRQGGEG